MAFDESRNTSFIVNGYCRYRGRHIDLGMGRWSSPAKISVCSQKVSS